jgi:hypothetical protein
MMIAQTAMNTSSTRAVMPGQTPVNGEVGVG